MEQSTALAQQLHKGVEKSEISHGIELSPAQNHVE